MINADDLPAVQAADAPAAPRRLMQAFAALDAPADGGDFAGLVDSVDAAPEEVGEPVTLAQAKAHLRVVVPDEDTYITDLIVAARQMAEGRINRALVQRQFVEVFGGCVRLALPKPPIVSVDSVVVTDLLRVPTTLDSADYYLDMAGGAARLQAAPGRTWLRATSQVEVTYTAGYAPGAVPQPIVQWMLLVIGSLYENRETMSAGVEVFSIPDNFMSLLLQPYMVYE